MNNIELLQEITYRPEKCPTMAPLAYGLICELNKKIAEAKDLALKYLARVGLEGKHNEYPSKLSGGQCQRVAIARAMINNPKVVFADEPTASLDHENAFNVMKILKKYSEDRLVLVVSHDRTILKESDMIIEMWDGEVTL